MDKAHLNLLARLGTALYQQDNLQQADLDAVYDEIEALVAEVERLRAEATFLRACVPPTHPRDYGYEAWEERLRAEVDAERAAVLRWLRRWDANVYPSWVALADEIERGEHRREE